MSREGGLSPKFALNSDAVGDLRQLSDSDISELDDSERRVVEALSKSSSSLSRRSSISSSSSDDFEFLEDFESPFAKKDKRSLVFLKGLQLWAVINVLVFAVIPAIIVYTVLLHFVRQDFKKLNVGAIERSANAIAKAIQSDLMDVETNAHTLSVDFQDLDIETYDKNLTPSENIYEPLAVAASAVLYSALFTVRLIYVDSGRYFGFRALESSVAYTKEDKRSYIFRTVFDNSTLINYNLWADLSVLESFHMYHHYEPKRIDWINHIRTFPHSKGRWALVESTHGSTVQFLHPVRKDGHMFAVLACTLNTQEMITTELAKSGSTTYFVVDRRTNQLVDYSEKDMSFVSQDDYVIPTLSVEAAAVLVHNKDLQGVNNYIKETFGSWENVRDETVWYQNELVFSVKTIDQTGIEWAVVCLSRVDLSPMSLQNMAYAISFIVVVTVVFEYIMWNFFLKPLLRLSKEMMYTASLNFNYKAPRRGMVFRELKTLSNSVEAIRIAVRAMTKYTEPDVVLDIIKHDYRLGGMFTNVVLLCVDIQGFTTMCEKYPAGTISQLLTVWFRSFCDIIHENQGMVDKFCGDAINGFFMYDKSSQIALTEEEKEFGLKPSKQSESPHKRAVRCAMQFADAMVEINKVAKLLQLPEIVYRVGIHAEESFIGYMGDDSVYKYISFTITGPVVSTADHMQEASKAYGLQPLISQPVQQAVASRFFCIPVDIIQLRAQERPMYVYHVACEKPSETADMRSVHAFLSDSLCILEQFMGIDDENIYSEDDAVVLTHETIKEINIFLECHKYPQYEKVLRHLRGKLLAYTSG